MREFLLTIQRTLFLNKKKMEQILDVAPEFDKKFTTIISCTSTPNYLNMIDWINTNSKDAVEVKIEGNIIFVGFVNSDDALFFKIKYSI